MCEIPDYRKQSTAVKAKRRKGDNPGGFNPAGALSTPTVVSQGRRIKFGER